MFKIYDNKQFMRREIYADDNHIRAWMDRPTLIDLHMIYEADDLRCSKDLEWQHTIFQADMPFGHFPDIGA
jgi:hypothetical protein